MNWNSGRLWLRIAVYGTGTLMACLIITQTLIFWKYDEAAVRQTLTHALQDSGRHVEITGTITPRVLPFPGVDIHDIAITARDGNTPFAHIRNLSARLSWRGLLFGNLIVNSLSLQDFDATIEHDKDGSLSISDLLARHPQDTFSVKLDTLALREGNVRYIDGFNGNSHALRAISLDATGLQGEARLSAGALLTEGNHPLRLAITTPLTIQDDQVALSELDAVVMSDVEGLGESRLQAKGRYQLNLATLKAKGENLVVTFTSSKPASSVTLTMPVLNAGLDEVVIPQSHVEGHLGYERSQYRVSADLDNLKAGPGRLAADKVTGEFNWQVGEHRVKLNLSAPLFLAGGDRFRLDPLTLTAQAITPLLPRGKLISTMQGALDGSLDNSRLNLRVAGKIDGSDITATISQYNFIRPRHEVTLDIGKLDLNRYLPEAHGNPIGLFESTEPVSLEWLDFFDLTGKVGIGELAVGRFRMTDISTDVQANARELNLSRMSANIYGGRLAGQARLARQKDVARIELKQTLDGMSIQPLLVDLFNFSRLEGRGSGQIDVSARGKRFIDLRNSLSGDTTIGLNKGALTGIDLVAALKNLPSELKEWNSPAKSDQKTTFSSLSARFRLDNGIGRNQDMRLNSQLVNVNGNGKVDLKQGIVDYAMDVQANPVEFSRLKGVNVPLKITGPINAPVYALDFNALVKGKKTEKEKKDALQQQLKNQLTSILPEVGPKKP